MRRSDGDFVIFTETPLKGAYILEVERREDDRGFFGRAWDAEEFSARGLAARFVQGNISFNTQRGTLRGMHYQAQPYGETKLVRCPRGAIHDVIIDLRPDSTTYTRWFGVELREGDGRLLYVPEQFAHGYLTLDDATEVTYQVSQFYASEFERGVRYNDPAFGIEWPLKVSVISPKDRSWPDFDSEKS